MQRNIHNIHYCFVCILYVLFLSLPNLVFSLSFVFVFSWTWSLQSVILFILCALSVSFLDIKTRWFEIGWLKMSVKKTRVTALYKRSVPGHLTFASVCFIIIYCEPEGPSLLRLCFNFRDKKGLRACKISTMYTTRHKFWPYIWKK